MKNTTLNRKPQEEMSKGAGEYRPRKTASQSGDGADFAFNGQMGDGVNRDAVGAEFIRHRLCHAQRTEVDRPRHH